MNEIGGHFLLALHCLIGHPGAKAGASKSHSIGLATYEAHMQEHEVGMYYDYGTAGYVHRGAVVGVHVCDSFISRVYFLREAHNAVTTCCDNMTCHPALKGYD